MTVFLDKHSKFLTDFYNSSKLDSNALTVIPSIVFLSTTFTQLYLQIQEYQIEAGWKGMFYKVRIKLFKLFFRHLNSTDLFSGIALPLGVFLRFQIMVLFHETYEIQYANNRRLYNGKKLLFYLQYNKRCILLFLDHEPRRRNTLQYNSNKFMCVYSGFCSLIFTPHVYGHVSYLFPKFTKSRSVVCKYVFFQNQNS